MTAQRDRHALYSVCLAVLLSAQVFGQMTVTGTINGSVTDPTAQVIAGARVTLTSERTKEVHTTTTNPVGQFHFTAIPPDSYSLKVENSGFKASQRTGIVLTANETLSLGELQLDIGAVSDTVTIHAEAAHVETDSSEASAEITTNQIGNLTARGRDVVSLLRTIPGVSYQADQDSAGGQYGTGTPSIRGTSNNTNILSVDGVVSNDMGTPNVFSSVTTMDAIGEVKVVLNSYRAEYAGNGGPVVTIVSKSGGTEYHGAGYWYARNEDLNANDFFNNRNSVRRPEYRYNTLGFSLGGPIYIPGKFNTGKTKLFGFYNFEQLLDRIPGSLTNYMMPTASSAPATSPRPSTPTAS
jgi:Outer membrane receptor for ferrienterochelin and colicins